MGCFYGHLFPDSDWDGKNSGTSLGRLAIKVIYYRANVRLAFYSVPLNYFFLTMHFTWQTVP